VPHSHKLSVSHSLFINALFAISTTFALPRDFTSDCKDASAHPTEQPGFGCSSNENERPANTINLAWATGVCTPRCFVAAGLNEPCLACAFLAKLFGTANSGASEWAAFQVKREFKLGCY
jgi:hypothetical protein